MVGDFNTFNRQKKIGGAAAERTFIFFIIKTRFKWSTAPNRNRERSKQNQNVFKPINGLVQQSKYKI
jgi:hypothetical protein